MAVSKPQRPHGSGGNRTPHRLLKMGSTKAATSEGPRHTGGWYVEDPSDMRTTVEAFFSSL